MEMGQGGMGCCGWSRWGWRVGWNAQGAILGLCGTDFPTPNTQPFTTNPLKDRWPARAQHMDNARWEGVVNQGGVGWAVVVGVVGLGWGG